MDAQLVPFLVILIIYGAVFFSSGYAFVDEIKWSLTFSISGNSAFQLQPNTTYTLLLQLTRSYSNQTEVLCPECSAQLWDLGGYPLFSIGLSPNLSETYSMRDYFEISTLTWSMNYTTSAEPGMVTFNIDTSPFIADFDLFLKKSTFSFSITRFVNADGTKSLLGPGQSSASLILSSDESKYTSYFSVLNSTHFAFTPDHWKSSMIVNHNFTFNPVPGNVCNVSLDTSFNLRSLLFFPSFTLVATNRGLFKLNTQSGESSLILSQCVLGMSVLPYPLACYTKPLIYTNTRIWQMDSSGSLYEVVDKNNLSLQRVFPNSYQLLSVTIASQNCSEFATLISSNDRYYIVNFHQNSWEVSFMYPRTVPQFSPFSSILLQNETLDLEPSSLGITNYTSIPLVLTDLQYSRHPSSHLIIYGSCVFLSPNDGLTQYLVSVPASYMTDYITSLTSSLKNDYYYFVTASGNLYYGSLFQSTTGFLERFSTPILFLEFDFDNTLYSLKSSFPNLPVREDLDPEATLSQAMLVQKPSDASCYIEAVNLMGSTDPKYTRVNGLSNDLPDAIFLDYKATYEFTLEVSPVFGTPLSKVKAGFVLSHRDWISVNTVRIEDYHLNLVKYLVTLQDSGDFNEQQLPEAIKSSTTLFILIYDSTYCIDYTPRSIVIYSGCPPFQTIEVGKPKKTMCIDPNPKYPCQYVDEDYLPTFYLVDMVTSQKVRFNLSYTLQVVGGGLSLSNLSNFPADKISTINSQTWGPADDLPQLSDGRYVFKASKNALFFICAGESPCAKVFPQFPNPAQYYFITLMTNKGISENRTYCELQLLYVFRLHGLNVDFLTASLITFLTFAVTLALVLGIAMIRFMKTKRELLKVGISDVQFKSRTLMGKSNSIKPGTSNEKLAGTSGTKKSTQDLRSNLAAGKSILKSRSLVPEENY